MAIETWLLPALIALLLNGVTTFLPKLTLQSLRLLDLAVYHAIFFFVGAVLIQPFYNGIVFEQRGLTLAIINGIIGTGGQILYLVAVKNGPVGKVSMVSSLYPLIATLLAFLTLHEELTVRQWLGIILGVASIILLVGIRDAKQV